MNYRNGAPLFAGMAAVLCGMSAIAFAPSGGRLMTVLGSADILRNETTVRAEKGGVLQSGDQLKTAADGRLQWWMEDDSLVAMASSSRVHIRHFEPEAKEATYALQSGAMRIVSGNLHPNVLTPMAKVTAMGTDFSTFLCTGGCVSKRAGAAEGAPQVMYVTVAQGRVRVQNSAGSVEASQGQVVYVGSATEAPVITAQIGALILGMSAELEFEIGAGDFVPDVPIQPLQPIPPGEPPGSPS